MFWVRSLRLQAWLPYGLRQFTNSPGHRFFHGSPVVTRYYTTISDAPSAPAEGTASSISSAAATSEPTHQPIQPSKRIQSGQQNKKPHTEQHRNKEHRPPPPASSDAPSAPAESDASSAPSTPTTSQQGQSSKQPQESRSHKNLQRKQFKGDGGRHATSSASNDAPLVPAEGARSSMSNAAATSGQRPQQQQTSKEPRGAWQNGKYTGQHPDKEYNRPRPPAGQPAGSRDKLQNVRPPDAARKQPPSAGGKPTERHERPQKDTGGDNWNPKGVERKAGYRQDKAQAQQGSDGKWSHKDRQPPEKQGSRMEKKQEAYRHSLKGDKPRKTTATVPGNKAASATAVMASAAVATAAAATVATVAAQSDTPIASLDTRSTTLPPGTPARTAPTEISSAVPLSANVDTPKVPTDDTSAESTHQVWLDALLLEARMKIDNYELTQADHQLSLAAERGGTENKGYLYLLSMLRLKQRRIPEAAAARDKLVELYPDVLEKPMFLCYDAWLSVHQQQPGRALELLEKADSFGADAPKDTTYVRALLFTGQNQLERAEDVLRKAVLPDGKLSELKDTVDVKLAILLAEILTMQNRAKEAEPLVLPIVTASTAINGPQHAVTLCAIQQQAAVFHALNKHNEAVSLLQPVAEDLSHQLGPHELTVSALGLLTRVYLDLFLGCRLQSGPAPDSVLTKAALDTLEALQKTVKEWVAMSEKLDPQGPDYETAKLQLEIVQLVCRLEGIDQDPLGAVDARSS